DATPADRGAANINYERKPLAVPGTWNPGTNYADSRYQLPQIDKDASRFIHLRNKSLTNLNSWPGYTKIANQRKIQVVLVSASSQTT
ncbi:hypothetical protein ACL1A6_07245, partial [Corynebacterium striatum]